MYIKPLTSKFYKSIILFSSLPDCITDSETFVFERLYSLKITVVLPRSIFFGCYYLSDEESHVRSTGVKITVRHVRVAN